MNATVARHRKPCAQSNLDEAWEIAERGSMKLFIADIQTLARNLSAEEILAWCDDVRQEFSSSDYPAEAMKLHAQAAFVSKRAGLEATARHHGDEAARLLRRLDLGNDADRILALTRSAATTDRPSLKRFARPAGRERVGRDRRPAVVRRERELDHVFAAQARDELVRPACAITLPWSTIATRSHCRSASSM